jgi:hypothetical protein
MGLPDGFEAFHRRAVVAPQEGAISLLTAPTQVRSM